MHSQTRDVQCCLGPALTAAGKVMGHVGGKMAVMCASLPSTGEAALKHRENPRALGTDREHLLLKAENTWYQVNDSFFFFVGVCFCTFGVPVCCLADLLRVFLVLLDFLSAMFCSW